MHAILHSFMSHPSEIHGVGERKENEIVPLVIGSSSTNNYGGFVNLLHGYYGALIDEISLLIEDCLVTDGTALRLSQVVILQPCLKPVYCRYFDPYSSITPYVMPCIL